MYIRKFLLGVAILALLISPHLATAQGEHLANLGDKSESNSCHEAREAAHQRVQFEIEQFRTRRPGHDTYLEHSARVDAAFAAYEELLRQPCPTASTNFAKPVYPESMKKTFKNCQEALDAIIKKEIKAQTTWGFKPILHGQSTVEKLPNGKFKATQKTDFIYAPTLSKTEMPTVTWPNMTDAEKQALKEVMDALLVHEQGHISIVKRELEKLSGKTSAEGSTIKEALKKLKEEISNDKIREKVTEVNRKYDIATDHGRKQSQGSKHGYPGGNDAVFKCP